MQNQKNNSSSSSSSNSGNPLLIIGAVFLLVLIGGWWFYSSSQSKPIPPANMAAGTNSPAPNAQDAYNRASPGAQQPHILGSQTATVTVEEFADFQCGACALKNPVLKQIASIYNNRIKFIFRHFPLIQQHPKSYDAAVATEAAGMQNKFWDMQNLLFTKQAEWSAATDHRKMFADYAAQIGLDVPKFQADLLNIAAKQRVDNDLTRGRSLQVRSTPTVFVNGLPIPYEQITVEGLRQIIDAELQKGDNNQTPPGIGKSSETAEPVTNSQSPPKGETSGSNKSASNK